MQNINKLPKPSDLIKKHSDELAGKIKNLISANNNWISFDVFMEQALYNPDYGYYSANNQKFGAHGDFTTAPELSSLFGKTLAQNFIYLSNNLNNLNNLNKNLDIVEIGAGSGKLAFDILTELDTQNCLPEKYYILEISADLKYRQQDLLNKLPKYIFEKIVWLDEIPNNINNINKISGMILANELFDALPVKIFNYNFLDNFLSEVGVSLDKNNNFYFQHKNPENNLAEYFKKNIYSHIISEQNNISYNSECNLYLEHWMNSLEKLLDSGILVIIDYGFPRQEYYHPSRYMGTLMCHYRNYAHSEVFLYPGLQDITTHVDFTALAEAALENNWQIAGFFNQADYLLGLGIDQILLRYLDNPDNFRLFSQQLQILLFPHEMGELFKVLVLAKNLDLENQNPLPNNLLEFDKKYRLGNFP